MLNLKPARHARRGLASLDAYRAAEAARGPGRGDPHSEPALASHPSFDVEYEALALRVAPPEVTVDNGGSGEATTLTVDSANRAGTLITVVEFLTERGLDVRSARISSDGGWFYDGRGRREVAARAPRPAARPNSTPAPSSFSL